MTGAAGGQLRLELERPEDLASRLRRLGLPGAIRVTHHRNRRTMVTLADGRLRIHEGYAWAPDPVLEAIVRWTRPRLPPAERRAAATLLRGFPVHRFIAPAPPRRRAPAPPGPRDGDWLARLGALHAELNREWFGGLLEPIPIRLSGIMRRKLGHYEVREPGGSGRIAISRRHIQRDGWRAAGQTLLHEMVHQWQDETGRPVDHGPDFRRKAVAVGIPPRAASPGRRTGG